MDPLKQKLSSVSEWFRIKLFGPESPKVHLLDIEIGISTFLIALIVAGTSLGVYFGRHWVWGTLLQITGTKNAISSTSPSSGSSQSSGSGSSNQSGNGGNSGGNNPGSPDPGAPDPENPNKPFSQIGWVTNCPYDHTLNDDPILYFGKPGKAASTDFNGNTTTDANSTYDSLRAAAGKTGCIEHANKWDGSAYYHPTMYLSGTAVSAQGGMFDYYLQPKDAGDPTTIQPFPAGIELVGDASHTFFSCTGGNAPLQRDPYDCTNYHRSDGSDAFVYSITAMPNCWDGKGLNPSDIQYSANQTCPSGFTTTLPQLKIQFIWKTLRNATGATFATTDGKNNGGFYAEFYEAWRVDVMSFLTVNCLQASFNCGALNNASSRLCKEKGICGGPQGLLPRTYNKSLDVADTSVKTVFVN